MYHSCHESTFLYSSVQVFAWGCGSCLGCGSSETTSLRPRFVEDLSITKIIDISCGDSHCLALSHGKWPSTDTSHDCCQIQHHSMALISSRFILCKQRF